MARADLLLHLAEAALSGDDDRVRTTIEALSAEERVKRHTVLAEDLARLLNRPRRPPVRSHGAIGKNDDGFAEIYPKRRLQELALPDIARDELSMLVEEQIRSDVLRAYNVEPRHRVLLVGPPGNGKTSCAEALATELAVPLLVVRYEAIITSFLGETSTKLGQVLDEARRRHCVLFLDEFDALAKERGDEHDAGEMKRIVSTLLLQLDRLPSHVVVCAATNHSELLDRAVWRRFQARITLPAPTREQSLRFAEQVRDRLGMHLPRSLRTIIDKIGAISYAEVEDILVELRRRQILAGDYEGRDTAVVERLLQAWAARATAPEESG